MKTPRRRLARMIAEKTLQKGSSKQLSQEVAAYLLTERRVSELDSILRDVQAAWAEAGYVEVIATSAHPLTDTIADDIRQHMAQLYPNAEVVITEVHDPEVVGGVRLSLADQQLDLSIEAKLNKFKQLTAAGKD